MKIIVNNQELTYGIVTDSLGEHRTWTALSGLRAYSNINAATQTLMIDIVDAQGMDVAHKEIPLVSADVPFDEYVEITQDVLERMFCLQCPSCEEYLDIVRSRTDSIVWDTWDCRGCNVGSHCDRRGNTVYICPNCSTNIVHYGEFVRKVFA